MNGTNMKEISSRIDFLRHAGENKRELVTCIDNKQDEESIHPSLIHICVNVEYEPLTYRKC